MHPAEVLHEVEAADTNGNLASVTTVLLRGSECAFRCTMCDLWKMTHLGPTPPGNLPAQVKEALSQPAEEQGTGHKWIKLYNASNFFAPYNVPPEDLPAIAEATQPFDRVIVENHPRLTSPKIRSFSGQLRGQLEIAMGLETVHAPTLRQLNKQLTVDDVREAVEQLTNMGVDTRLFVLLRPPGQSESQGVEYCLESIAAARDWGVRHVSIIPVRGGNGAMEFLQAEGRFEPPLASSLEKVLHESVAQSSMVVTADLWDWQRLRGICVHCNQLRYDNLLHVNLTQRRTQLLDLPCSCPCTSNLPC